MVRNCLQLPALEIVQGKLWRPAALLLSAHMTQTTASSLSGTFVPNGHPCGSEELRSEVEKRYSAKAEFAYTVPVRHLFGEVVWEGPVCVFLLSGHPTATKAFAWTTLDGVMQEHHVALESKAVPQAAEAVRLVLARLNRAE
jgi:hypothetical protein